MKEIYIKTYVLFHIIAILKNLIFLYKIPPCLIIFFTHQVLLEIFTLQSNINLLSKSESVKYSLIESMICLFTELSVETIFFTVKSVIFH